MSGRHNNKDRKTPLWSGPEWNAVDSALEFLNGWATIDRIATESNVRPNVAKAILEEMSRSDIGVIRKGKKYRYVE